MFFPEQAPKAVENFTTLAEKGYYNGLRFHRVIDGFMIDLETIYDDSFLIEAFGTTEAH